MYQDAVRKYHHPDDKKQKQEMENFIKKIKDNCKSDLSSNNPIKTKLRQKEGELENLDVQLQLLGESEIDKKVREQNKEKLGEEISKLRAELQEIERGKIYQNAFEWRFEFPEVLNKEGDFVGFDVVIENPPYITYHGRRRVIIFNEVINYFKNTYDCAKDTKKDGKFNSAMFFIEKSSSIGNANSISCLITDISFYEDFYAGVKRILINTTLVIEVVNGFSCFEDVASGQLILLFQNLPYKERKIIINNKVRVLSKGLDDEVRLVNQKLWDNVDKKYQFYLPEDNHNSIIEKFENNNQPLDFYFPYKLIRTGESIGVQEEGFVIDSMTDEKGIKIYEYLEGSKSVPYKYCKPIPTRWFRLDIALLNQRNEAYKIEAKKNNRNNPKVLGIGDKLAFDNPKILIRQSCDHLCCTYSEKPFVYNRSYYSISDQNSSGKSATNLVYVLGLLNSKLFTYYAQKKRIIRMEVGKQPQIRLNDLKKLPMKYADNEFEEKIVHKVNAILLAKESNANTNTTALEQEIDQLVYQLYGLTEEEIQIVEAKTN
ncbi:MAG: Eco57I restriction-modification methylase domain-containing protein [Dolichospermum sp.]